MAVTSWLAVSVVSVGLSAAPAGGAAPQRTEPTAPAPPAVSGYEPGSAVRQGGRPPAGNPGGHAPVPAAARAVDTSHPTRVIGRGTAASCTSAKVVRAVRRGGLITFDCGPRPVTITMRRTAMVHNTRRRVVLDGGSKVTLSGAGKRRIIYQNTCDRKLTWTTSHCNDQATPELVLQNLTFVRGDATGRLQEGGGGGAVFVRGGRLKIVNSRFFRNRCDTTGPDLGGAAVRVLDQHHDLPVYVVHSTFGGAKGLGGQCSNGGALSSIGVSWVVLNSVISHNRAIGRGANPARGGTPGGGSGGGIYTDGNDFTVTLAGTLMARNVAREGGGAVFFVSNDRSGRMTIDHSVLRRNRSNGFETAGYPGIFFLGAGRPQVIDSTIR